MKVTVSQAVGEYDSLLAAWIELLSLKNRPLDATSGMEGECSHRAMSSVD